MWLRDASILAAEEEAAVVKNAIHDNLLIDGARNDGEFHHGGVDVAFVPSKLICASQNVVLVFWQLPSESKGRKSVHQKVNPQHYSRLYRKIAEQKGADADIEHKINGNGDLKLQKLSDVFKDVSAKLNWVQQYLDIFIYY